MYSTVNHLFANTGSYIIANLLNKQLQMVFKYTHFEDMT